MSIKAKPANNGIKTLSFTGKGRLSIAIATAAPIKASQGDMKMEPPTNAKMNPITEPSKVLALLNDNGFLDIYPPKSEAMLSPNTNMAMAALLIGAGNSNKVANTPMAKYSGAAVNSYSSACEAAFLVIVDMSGKEFPLSLASSDME